MAPMRVKCLSAVKAIAPVNMIQIVTALPYVAPRARLISAIFPKFNWIIPETAVMAMQKPTMISVIAGYTWDCSKSSAAEDQHGVEVRLQSVSSEVCVFVVVLRSNTAGCMGGIGNQIRCYPIVRISLPAG
jgi:hypothetical protein